MGNKPALRTESPLERRMKRDLRRYITAYHRAINHVLSAHDPLFKAWLLSVEISQVPMPTAHRGDISNMTEHRLGMMCAEMGFMIRDARESESLDPTRCAKLAERCKGRLTAARRDKPVTS